MPKLYLLSLLLVAVCLAPLTSAARKPKSRSKEDVFINSTESCESIFNETALLVKPVLLVGTRTYPLTIAEIDEHCKLGNSVYKKMRKYGKCLEGLGRQTLSIYLHGLKRFLRSICNSNQKKEEAIEHLRCATDTTLDGWNSCLNIVNQQLDFIADNSTSVGVIGDVCCVYSTVMDCISAKTATKPGCSPTADTPKFFKTSLELVLKEVIELICSRYTSKEECELNNPEGLAKIKAIIGSDRKVNGAYLLSPLLKIVGKLSSDHES